MWDHISGIDQYGVVMRCPDFRGLELCEYLGQPGIKISASPVYDQYQVVSAMHQIQ